MCPSHAWSCSSGGTRGPALTLWAPQHVQTQQAHTHTETHTHTDTHTYTHTHTHTLEFISWGRFLQDTLHDTLTPCHPAQEATFQGFCTRPACSCVCECVCVCVGVCVCVCVCFVMCVCECC